MFGSRVAKGAFIPILFPYFLQVLPYVSLIFTEKFLPLVYSQACRTMWMGLTHNEIHHLDAFQHLYTVRHHEACHITRIGLIHNEIHSGKQ